jgi:hypothetical protein
MADFVPFASKLTSKEEEDNGVTFVPFSAPLPKTQPTVEQPLPQEDYATEQNTTYVEDIDAPTMGQQTSEAELQMNEMLDQAKADESYEDPRLKTAIEKTRIQYTEAYGDDYIEAQSGMVSDTNQKIIERRDQLIDAINTKYTDESGNLSEVGQLQLDKVQEQFQTTEFIPRNFEEDIQKQADYISEYMSQTDNPIHRKLIDEMLDKDFAVNTIYGVMNGLEWSPVMGAALSAEETDDMYEIAQRFWDEGGLANNLIGTAVIGAQLVEVGLSAMVGGKVAKKGVQLLTGTNIKKMARAKLNAKGAAAAETEVAQKAAVEAKKVAEANKDVQQALIEAFETRTGKTISTGDAGKKVIDPTLVRQAGKETSEEILNYKNKPVKDTLEEGLVDQTVQFAHLTDDPDVLVSALLKPEKFNGIVAVASELKKSNPSAFSSNETLIDDLFALTVNEDLLASDTLADMLTKYNISFDDYVLTVVGAGSEAGKILNKLSQIARARPAGAGKAAKENAAKNAAGDIRKTVMRIENVRRGGLVSQLATASRNLTSGAIRAPMESLGNVMDESLYRLSTGNKTGAIGAIFDGDVWTDSFRQMKYMFRNPIEAKRYTDLLLKRPELGDQFDRMFNNINEIQALTGRGKGGAVDTVLSALEDGVDVINTPNRMQEYLIRRGAFFGELERLSRREWDIDLVDALNEGKVRDLLNDASSVRPAGTRSFMELVDDSVNKALDITYAKQPDIPVFQSTASFIVRNGLTTVMPFPRFMFNSMELLGQYAGGASIPITRKMASLVSKGQRGPLTAKDRQRIQRNILGWSAIGAAYQYRTSEDANADYKMVTTSDDEMLDTTPQYPLRQFLYLGEATKRAMDGTLGDWFDVREFQDTFLGVNFRTGVGNVFLEEVADLATGLDLTAEETTAKALGGALGQYLSTWAVPFGQVIESQRAAGLRGTAYKDVREDPDLGFWSTLGKEVKRPFDQRGFTMSAEEEAALPEREFLYAEGGTKDRTNVLSRVIFGLNFQEKDAKYGEYLKSKGMQEWELGSKSRVPSIQRAENKELRKHIPTIVAIAESMEGYVRDAYQTKSLEFKEKITENQYVNSEIVPLIKSQVSNLKSQLRDAGMEYMSGDPYLIAQTKYRRMSPDFRKYATVKFIEENGRSPDGSSAEDLQQMIMLGEAYKEAIR